MERPEQNIMRPREPVQASRSDASRAVNSSSQWKRWLRFSGVGALGATVQLSALYLLSNLLKTPAVMSTVAAVELTLAHNFIWHQRFTWSDRPCSTPADSLRRFLAFQTSNGAVSLLGNVTITFFILQTSQLPIMVASLIAIGVCSMVNFVIGDRWIFTA